MITPRSPVLKKILPSAATGVTPSVAACWARHLGRRSKVKALDTGKVIAADVDALIIYKGAAAAVAAVAFPEELGPVGRQLE